MVVAAPGYPDRPLSGGLIEGADPSGSDDVGPLLCFHAGTRRGADGYEASGGRVVTFVGIGGTLAEARQVAYRGVAGCSLEGAQHRDDIAARELSEEPAPVSPAGRWPR